MFDLSPLIRSLQGVLQAFDPATVTGPAAVRLVDEFAQLERLAAAGKALAAARAAETQQWRHGAARSAADWLARRTGTSVGAAKEALATAERVAELPDTAASLRSGVLSLEQAAVVSGAAVTAPAAERELLATAASGTLRELRDEAARVRAAHVPDRTDAIHRERRVREWVDDNDVWHLHASGTKLAGAAFMARLRPMIDAEFRSARAEGRRESLDAYAFDGLMALAASGGSSKPVAKVIARVDLAALRRGQAAADEVCEIAGFGPVPAEALRDLLGASALAFVLTDGHDVVNVTHFGRKPTVHQQTALEWSQPTCVADGCSATARLERDHVVEWSTTRHTRLDELQRLCHTHHGMKTRGELVAVPP